MRDKFLTYALVVSIVVHLVLLGLVGKTSAAKPIAVDQLKIVNVDLVKTPDQVSINQDVQDQPKAEPIPTNSEAPFVPPVSKMVSAAEMRTSQPFRVVNNRVVPYLPSHNADQHSRTMMAKLPGDPGGALRGVSSPNGQDLGRVSSGSTPVGWVPGSDNGKGVGSGSGEGVGRPEPVEDAHPGPGTEPAPEPRINYVKVTICSASGMIAGQYCDNKDSKTFAEGDEPQRVCTSCKAPEPKYVSRLADRSEPQLVKDCDIKLPDLDESGDFEVRVRWTVDTDGNVTDVEVVDSSGNKAIDRAVCNAVSKRKYKPAVQDGEPRSVKMKQRFPIKY